MRKTGINRASADWFLNRVADRRCEVGKSCRWVFGNGHQRASAPLWNYIVLHGDEFHPAHKFKNAFAHKKDT